MFAKLLTLALAASSTLAFPISKRAFTGRTTFYRTTDSNPMTACGVMYNSDDEKIVALSMEQFDMSLCNTYLTAEYQGKQVTAKILDGCETCSYGDIDLSPGAMEELVGPNYDDIGQVTANWWFGGSGDSGSGGGSQEPEPSAAQSTWQEPEPSTAQSTWQDPTPSSTPSASAAPTPSPTPGKVFDVEDDETSATPSATESSAEASATDASPSDAAVEPSASAASASAEPSTEPSATPSTPAASAAAESQEPAGPPTNTPKAGFNFTGGEKQCKSNGGDKYHGGNNKSHSGDNKSHSGDNKSHGGDRH